MSFPAIISISSAAEAKINEILGTREGKALGIRISLKTKGCSGLSWELEIVDEDNNLDDKVKINDCLTIFIDKKATLFLLGTELDYAETDLESGFIFNNPKEKGKCGCGESFYV
ncbi:HesB/IscA family protein [Rickettsiales bacterium LUAb2]